MANIKLTKTELKNQRDALKRYTRYLPTLQLKKQQLQVEVQKVRDEVSLIIEEQKQLHADLNSWIELFSSKVFIDMKFDELVKIDKIDQEMTNVAGIDVPFFKGISFEPIHYDYFSTPAWLDKAVSTICKFIELNTKQGIIEERLEILEQELRTTNQRVNLFEKVKIPEARENIRHIRIYLGDQETAAVCRSKIAKRKIQESA